jgi:hypothetical protein
MTYRQRFERRVRAAMWPALGCFFLALVVTIIQQNLNLPNAPWAAAVFPLVVVTFLAAPVVQFVGFRCPDCRKNFGQHFCADGFRYCPHCAFDLEQEIGPADRAIPRP